MLPLNHRRTRSQSVWWIAGVCCLCVLSVSYSSNTSYCGPPCTARMCVNTSRTCLYGTYLVCGGCCYECLAGPGEWCKAFEPECGHGLHCVGALTEGPRSLHTPGTCERNENSTTTTSSVGTAEPSATTGVPMQTGVPPPTTATEEPTSGDDMSVNCRTPCSASFCSEDGTNKKRICAAAGLSPMIPERNKCQHTSCRSCFLLKDPDCHHVACPEPPNKLCLRFFYQCIRDHYFSPNSSAALLRLEDPAAQTTPGRVICHVPEVSGDRFSGQDGESSAVGP